MASPAHRAPFVLSPCSRRWPHRRREEHRRVSRMGTMMPPCGTGWIADTPAWPRQERHTRWKPAASHVCPAPSTWTAALPSPPRTAPAQTCGAREEWVNGTRDLSKGGEECPGRQRACEGMRAHADSVSMVLTLRKQPSVSPFPVLRGPGCEPTPDPGV
jgi:hypothetical protein